jgi:hypothetical protein
MILRISPALIVPLLIQQIKCLLFKALLLLLLILLLSILILLLQILYGNSMMKSHIKSISNSMIKELRRILFLLTLTLPLLGSLSGLLVIKILKIFSFSFLIIIIFYLYIKLLLSVWINIMFYKFFIGFIERVNIFGV